MQRNPLPVVSSTLCDELYVLDFLSPATFSLLSFSHTPKMCVCCCCCSAVQSCLTVCNPMTAAHQTSPSLPVSWSLPKFTVHCIGDAIQSAHPLTPSSPSAFNLFQHQGLFQ